MQKRKDRRIRQWNKAVMKAAPQGQDSLPPAEVKAFTYDLSIGGARIHSVERFEVGTVLRLKIEFVRSRETVSLKGQVKWVKRDEAENVFELGVEFDHDTALTVTSLMKNLHGAGL
ncbi:MAG: PilZ domain-containing protein [Candidatus Aminicenantes bacterium]|jgi:Tfp pilus assembly protein PilZ|nr:PilZ domain-containing protein [Candidatus Aminicenantes bacterium]